MKRLVICVILFLISKKINAQEYFNEGRNRLNFAKTYFELGGQYSPKFASNSLEGNDLKSFTNPASFVPYLNIGGLHFWGHADFYISIPLTQINTSKNENNNFRLNQSVVTGARFLPWAYRDKKIRPFVGTSWAVVNFKQSFKPNENQPLLSKNKLLFDAGLLFGNKNLLARVGANYLASNAWNYPISENNFQQIRTPKWSAYLGLVFTLETTRSKNMENENSRLNKYADVSKPTLSAIKKGDWFLGIGPSSSFMLAKSAYNEAYFPYFNKKPISNTYFDLAIGYQFNKTGIVSALSFIKTKFTNDAFGSKQTIRKNSIVIETYKFLTDYSGFTPYLGFNLAYDNFDYSEKTKTQEISKNFKEINPGLTLGWDILPGKTEQWFVLRTNLRWYPFSKIKLNDKQFSQAQIEYNVIQAVWYPSRYKNAKNKRNN
jgi:outer membrane protein W